MLNLDTHILILFLDEALTDRERNAIIAEGAAISDIVLWELAKLQQKSRASIVERIPLLTRDRRILKSKMVPFAF